VRAFGEAHPDAKLIRLGIGDVTQPLAPALVEALRDAAAEMGTPDGMRGYADEAYGFLAEAILEHDYRARGVELDASELFVSDGSKQDSGNIQEIFDRSCRIVVTDPVYPVYRRTGSYRARPRRRPISPISAPPTIPPGRWPRARTSRPGWPGPGATGRS
jgi:LL-diaminopimelate aminotransferase